MKTPIRILTILSTALGLGTAGAAVIPGTGLSPDLWLKANAGITFDTGSSVTTWADQSGFGHDATQLTGANMATLTTGATPNGGSTINFDGDDFFTLAAGSSSLLSQQYTVFVFLAPQTDSWRDRTILGGGSDQSMQYRINGNGTQGVLSQAAAGIGNSNTALPNASSGTTFSSINTAVNYSTGAYSFRLNGSADGSGTATPGTFNFTINNLGTRHDTADWEAFQGKISEVILFKGVLSDTDRSNVETYMNNTWVAAVPEPATWALLAFSLTTVVILRRRRA